MERLKESHTTIAENIDYISSLEEKLRIVKTMLDNYYRPEEVAYLVELPLEYIEAIEEKYEKCEKLVKQAVNKSFWNNKLINLFTKLQIEGFSINMKEELSNIHKKMVMKARRKIKLRVAYRMVDSDDFITNIARITGLEIKEVEYLADIFIIRREERERTTKKVAQIGLKEQVGQELISRLTGLSLEELLELQAQISLPEQGEPISYIYGEELEDDKNDEELYNFHYSFLNNKDTTG